MKTLYISLIAGFSILVLFNANIIYAESEKQFTSTDVGTYEVSLKTNPPTPQTGEQTYLFIEVLTKPTRLAQVHVDYELVILKDMEQLFSSSAKHTHTGQASVTHTFDEPGEYLIGVYLDGIMFSPISTETAEFKLNLGDVVGGSQEESETEVIETGSNNSKTSIPDWIKQVAEFWIADQIDDAGFVQVIEFLVKEGIITIAYIEAPEGDAATQIPSWIKTNTEFWIAGNISDDEFAIGMEWLINNGIIRVQDVKERAVSSYQIEGNYYPIYQFQITPNSPDCPDNHLHATSGFTVDAVHVSFTDHNPGGCGLGTVDSLIQHYTMTENQILKWEEITRIKIPKE